MVLRCILSILVLAFGAVPWSQEAIAEGAKVVKQKGCRLTIQGLDAEQGSVVDIEARTGSVKAKVKKSTKNKSIAVLSKKSCKIDALGASVGKGSDSLKLGPGSLGVLVTIGAEIITFKLQLPEGGSYDGNPESFKGQSLGLLASYTIPLGAISVPLVSGLVITNFSGRIDYTLPGFFVSMVPDISLYFLRFGGGIEYPLGALRLSSLGFVDYSLSGSSTTQIYTASQTAAGSSENDETIKASASALRYGITVQGSYSLGKFEILGGAGYSFGSVKNAGGDQDAKPSSFTDLSLYVGAGARL